MSKHKLKKKVHKIHLHYHVYTAINSEVIATKLKELADLKARLRVPELQLAKAKDSYWSRRQNYAISFKTI